MRMKLEHHTRRGPARLKPALYRKSRDIEALRLTRDEVETQDDREQDDFDTAADLVREVDLPDWRELRAH
jgi:hypothetical protein